MAEVLKYGPDVNGLDTNDDTALTLIFTGAHPHRSDEGAQDEDARIIQILGKAGADPNVTTASQEGLLDVAYSPEDKAALIAIGARPQKK